MRCRSGGAAGNWGHTHLLLEGRGHQAPQLREAAVDTVAASLLDDLREISKREEENTVIYGHGSWV